MKLNGGVHFVNVISDTNHCMDQNQKQELKRLLFQAHQQACHRENASTQILKAAYGSNGKDVIRSIQAALGMIGGLHAPTIYTHQMIKHVQIRESVCWNDLVHYRLGYKIPGFGSSFYKDCADPILHDMHYFLSSTSKDYVNILSQIQGIISQVKKNILFPNLAFFTAWTAIELDYDAAETELLIVEARVPEWVKILKAL